MVFSWQRDCAYSHATPVPDLRNPSSLTIFCALQAHDAGFARWLRDEIVPTYETTKADPASRIPAKAVFAEARAHYSGRRKVGR